jgi:hypothetical protein
MIEGKLTEAAGEAILNRGSLGADPRLYDYTFQFRGLGAGTVDIDVMGPAGEWAAWTTAQVDKEAVVVAVGHWTAFRFTFTGAGAGEVHYFAVERGW